MKLRTSQIIKTAILFAWFCPAIAMATDYYVSLSGSNSNPGTQEKPWQTIQHAAGAMSAGDRVLVQSGQYDERVTVSRSGSKDNLIIFEAQGSVGTKGFYLTGSYIRVQGFTVSTVLRGKNGIGIRSGGGHNEIINNIVVGAGNIGITAHGIGYHLVKGNTVTRASGVGILIGWAPNSIAEDNEVWDTRSLGDADAMRVFGSGHIIRRNYLHDIYKYDKAETSHTDAMQTFDTNGPDRSLINVVIEDNIVINSNKGFMGRAPSYGLSKNVVFRRNTFVNSPSFLINIHEIDNVTIEDNIFAYAKYAGVRLKNNADNSVIRNNIFFFTGDSYRASPIEASGNKIYPITPDDPIRKESTFKPGWQPTFKNAPRHVVRTDPKREGTSDSFYVLSSDLKYFDIGQIIEYNNDDIPRTVTAVNSLEGRVSFTPSLDGKIGNESSRKMGSVTVPRFLQAKGAALVSLWGANSVSLGVTNSNNSNVVENFELISPPNVKPNPPTNPAPMAVE